MTVYVTSAELLELEQARLLLRGQHGLAVDRGRLVREAISLVLADFEAHGDESVLVRRLTEGMSVSVDTDAGRPDTDQGTPAFEVGWTTSRVPSTCC